jgi:type VI protein secretion system component Hcp
MQPPELEELRQQRAPAPLSEHRVVKLQHVIGNQAVQRLLQRAPGDKKSGESSRPGVVATIVLESGKIEGRSKVAGHEGKLELISIQRGVDSAGNVFVQFTRNVDDVSPRLQEASVKGVAVKTAQFEILRHEDDEAKTILTLDLADGHITSFQIGTHEGVATETITITFGPDKKDDERG